MVGAGSSRAYGGSGIGGNGSGYANCEYDQNFNPLPYNPVLGSAGSPQTGSGGGGGSWDQTSGFSGSGGVVILRMPTSDYSGTTTGSPTVTTSDGDTIIKFTGSGSYTH